MSRNNRYRGNRKPNQRSDNRKIDANAEDSDNPVIQSFYKYSIELDDKHDRYERVVKLSRDITIESKRLIFLLHTIGTKKASSETVLSDADKRIKSLCSNQFAAIAKELQDLDPYQYARAYSAGLQEFVEAYTYYNYLRSVDSVLTWNEVQKQLTYAEEIPDQVEVEKQDTAQTEGSEDNENGAAKPIHKDIVLKEYKCLVQPIEFMLGLADLGGEVMRRCINSLGNGEVDTCFKICKDMQQLYSGFLSLGPIRNREMSRKIYTLRQSLLKVENVCYNVRVRGREAAKWGSDETYADDKHPVEEDEGFINY